MTKSGTDPVSQQGMFWVLWGDIDWVGARVLYLRKNPRLWMPAGLLGHKAIEQYLKALLRSNGDKTEWRGQRGHNLGFLRECCAKVDSYFSEEVIEHRLRVFNLIYLAWRYPQRVGRRKVSVWEAAKDINALGEVAVMGDNHLIELDELVEGIRSRIRLGCLGLPPTFQEMHESLPEGQPFLSLAKEENHTFERMEESSKRVNPPPVLRSQTS